MHSTLPSARMPQEVERPVLAWTQAPMDGSAAGFRTEAVVAVLSEPPLLPPQPHHSVPTRAMHCSGPQSNAEAPLPMATTRVVLSVVLPCPSLKPAASPTQRTRPPSRTQENPRPSASSSTPLAPTIWQAIVIGAIGAAIVVFTVPLLDKLKIDKSLVWGIEKDDKVLDLVISLVQLGRALELTTVAEGVETNAQSAFIEGAGCPELQGYLFCKPQSRAALDEWFATQAPAAEGSGESLKSPV